MITSSGSAGNNITESHRYNSTSSSSNMAFTMFSTVKTLDSKVYYLPHTLRNWPWQKSINPHYLSCQTESDAWLETLNPFTPKAQLAFNRCNFALLSALTNPKSSHCKQVFMVRQVRTHAKGYQLVSEALVT